MNAPFGFDPGWLAVSIASGLVIGASVGTAPTAPPVQVPVVAPRAELDWDFTVGAPDSTGTTEIAPDPFRGANDPSTWIDEGAPAVEALGSWSAIVSPRVVGVGRRADGVPFVGCDSPGSGFVIVRQGGLCGSARLIEIAGDSARFAIEGTDSILTVGIGGR